MQNIKENINSQKNKRFTDKNMKDFANFIRDNYYGVGAPKLLSYNHLKYPHGTIEEIFVVWCDNNGF